jgi:hypothetical protein
VTAAATFGELSSFHLPFGQFGGKRLAHVILWQIAVFFDEVMSKATEDFFLFSPFLLLLLASTDSTVRATYLAWPERENGLLGGARSCPNGSLNQDQSEFLATNTYRTS